MSQIRLQKTPDIERVLTFLQRKYQLLSEAEIIKVALSEKYHKEVQEYLEKDQKLKETYTHLMVEGKKIGNRLIRERKLDPKKVTEQQFYDLFLDDHRHA